MIHNLLIMFFPLFHPTVFTGGHTIVLIAELGERAGPRLRELGSTTRGSQEVGFIDSCNIGPTLLINSVHSFFFLCTSTLFCYSKELLSPKGDLKKLGDRLCLLRSLSLPPPSLAVPTAADHRMATAKTNGFLFSQAAPRNIERERERRGGTHAASSLRSLEALSSFLQATNQRPSSEREGGG